MTERYRTIVADPPWHYEGWTNNPTSRFRTVGTERKPLDYSSLTVDEIAALPVEGWAETNAHLYLWTTNRYLFDAKRVAEAWGFRYAQLLVWTKAPKGLGPGGAFAQNAEFILFCRRGKLPHRQKQDSVWFPWTRTTKHSVKPEAFIDLVEAVSPGPYLELFARRARFGWDYWGDESLETVKLPTHVNSAHCTCPFPGPLRPFPPHLYDDPGCPVHGREVPK